MSLYAQAKEALLLLLLPALQLALLGLPLLAGCVLAIRRGVRGAAGLALAFLLLLGGFGYGAFWLYLLHPAVGMAASLLLLAAGGVFVWRWRRGPRYAEERRLLRPLLVPLAVCALVTVATLQLGYVFGGVSQPVVTAIVRFTHPLPPDNLIPKLLADGLFAGQVPRPLISNWLASDRPPLQSGIFLIERPLVGRYDVLAYQVLSVFLQTLWILGLWAWLAAAGVRRRAALLVLAGTVCWGFTLVNQFYVWPKLFPAAYLLAICALVLTPRFAALRDSAAAGAAVGLAAALSLLAHGGAIFGLAGIGLALLLTGKYPGRRFVTAAVAAALCATLPWVGFQKLADPPGDGLIKLHLAGVEPDDPRSAPAAIRDAYAALSAQAIVANKLANLRMILGDVPGYVYGLRGLSERLAAFDVRGARPPAENLRGISFLSLAPALGVLTLGIPCLGWILLRRGRRTAEGSAAARAWLCALLVVPVWTLLMFGPAETKLHQGTYLLPLLAAAGSLLAAWAVAPALAAVLCALHAALNLVLYVALIPEAQVAAAVKTAFNPFAAALAGLTGAGLAWTLWRLARCTDRGAHPAMGAHRSGGD
jgi:hypothetical protein